MLKIELIANFFLKHKGIKKIINNKNFNIVIFYKPPKKNLFHIDELLILK